MEELHKLNRKGISLTILLTIIVATISFAQGPNRTFGKFKKVKENDKTEFICSDSCATIILIYEKGSFINNLKAAIGIDEQYAIASEKGYYIEYKIPAGVHKISQPQGVNQAGVFCEVKECKGTDTSFIGLCSMFSNVPNYQILLGSDISVLKYNLVGVPYTDKITGVMVIYFTYERDFKVGKTYYYKSLKLPKEFGNLGSLSCGPIITETTKGDFEQILKGKKIKGKGELLLYKRNPKF